MLYSSGLLNFIHFAFKEQYNETSSIESDTMLTDSVGTVKVIKICEKRLQWPLDFFFGI